MRRITHVIERIKRRITSSGRSRRRLRRLEYHLLLRTSTFDTLGIY
jgi:hypothetical protein